MARWAPVSLTLVAVVGIAAAGLAQERFDDRVRDDVFRGFAGNSAALNNALTIIDGTLAQNPDHAEALAWRGATRYWQAGQAFRAGEIAHAQNLAADALADMDRAVTLQPNNISVLIPRASVLLPAARNQRDPTRARNLAARAAADFEAALALRQSAFARLGQHNRGEYLSGLAESWALAGNRSKAETYLQRILAELPNSPYAERAAAKLANWDDLRPLNCQSCH